MSRGRLPLPAKNDAAMSATYAAWLSALAETGTLVVISASVLAALIQLRHIRAGNQLQALLSVERDFRAPELQYALMLCAKTASAAIGGSGVPARARDDRIRRYGGTSRDDRMQLAERNGDARQAWPRFRGHVYGSFRALDRPLLAAGCAGHCDHAPSLAVTLQYHDFEYLAMRAADMAGTQPRRDVSSRV